MTASHRVSREITGRNRQNKNRQPTNIHFMPGKEIDSGLNITRERMIQLLNEDLAGEYQAIIAYTVYSQVLKGAAYTDIARELEAHAGEELAHAIKIAKQIDYLGGMPGVTPKPVKTSNDPVTMLRADLENEQETVARYRERIKQAEAMGEFALSETLRAIIVQEQEHEIDLSAALDIAVPPIKQPEEKKLAATI
jgi:bacterioferritin